MSMIALLQGTEWDTVYGQFNKRKISTQQQYSFLASQSSFPHWIVSLDIGARQELLDHFVQRWLCAPWSLETWKYLRGYHRKWWWYTRGTGLWNLIQPASPGDGGVPFQVICFVYWYTIVSGVRISLFNKGLKNTNFNPPYPNFTDEKMRTQGGYITYPKWIFFLAHYQLNRLPKWLSGKRIHLPMQEMQEAWVWSLSQEVSLEKEMATQSSILVWEIPWTEEPCGLQPVGFQRVGHDWVTEHAAIKHKQNNMST